LTPRVSASRTVREYTEQHYLPAAAAYRERAADQGAAARNIVNWGHTLKDRWGTLRFRDVKVQTQAAQHSFEVEVCLNDLDPNVVRVELYAEGINGSGPIRQEMTRVQPPPGEPRGEIYRASVPATRLATDYTARIIPHRAGVGVPLEVDPILWQR
jgi:starch phosphorylase